MTLVEGWESGCAVATCAVPWTGAAGVGLLSSEAIVVSALGRDAGPTTDWVTAEDWACCSYCARVGLLLPACGTGTPETCYFSIQVRKHNMNIIHNKIRYFFYTDAYLKWKKGYCP